ncbi:arabinogalactan endo-1,4-beta-galactosidase [Kineococcus xinjiangensis]|uniref:Arabinogalactan endo-beta-1,4-galactanase n=1 Tax=Kineococcus xinjiangensis TaxID=512762 RepID=A0A2S6IHV0_9ACTN|nr:glycosyl hydrolase 53 family protein [Kineococcus xinjiangensis]PPK93750.1 arabinogalactan endo-1,4-beta-galactosidase [Kineococcus xinjiangensis]
MTTDRNNAVPRRTLLTGALAGTGLAALGATGAEAATGFVKGADISWVPQMEANGYYWCDRNGNRADILAILKTYGITAVRLRAFVNPSSSPQDGHCSTEETARFARRCKDAGMQVMIDPHFGDTWNSVGVQNPPAAWADMTYSQMQQAMYDYVYHLMMVLKYHRVSPAWVQLGNETNPGICVPTGSVRYNPAQLAGLLNAAHDMVKEVFPAAQTIVHLAQPQHGDVITNWLDTYRNHGGRWDISGFSSYASGAATIDAIANNIEGFKNRYGKPVMQVEFGGRWDRAERTKADLSYFIQKMRSIGALGLFYWAPEGYSPFTDYQMCAWDPATRRPTVAMDGFLV